MNKQNRVLVKPNLLTWTRKRKGFSFVSINALVSNLLFYSFSITVFNTL